MIVELSGTNWVRVEDEDRVLIRPDFGRRWEAYRVQDGLEMFTGYLCEESAARIEAAVGMRSGPMLESWAGRHCYGWKSFENQALGTDP